MCDFHGVFGAHTQFRACHANLVRFISNVCAARRDRIRISGCNTRNSNGCHVEGCDNSPQKAASRMQIFAKVLCTRINIVSVPVG